MNFEAYASKFTANTDAFQTHLSFDKKKYFVRDEDSIEFYKTYYACLMSSTAPLHIIEKVSGQSFKFFLDIDKCSEGSDAIRNIISDISLQSQVIITKREPQSGLSNFHIYFPSVITDIDKASSIIQRVRPELRKYIDASVYRTGLCLFGSRKLSGDMYKLYSLETNEYVPMTSVTFEKFMQMSIRINGQAPLHVTSCHVTSDESIAHEILKIVRVSCPLYAYASCKVDQNVVFVSIDAKYCPFKKDSHKRKSNPLYIRIAKDGVILKCHDEICRNKSEFICSASCINPIDYPRLCRIVYNYYEIYDESLSGTHFSTAKAFFETYKNMYRVDDARNPTWYKFDGLRWKQTNDITITLSVDFVKMYKDMISELEESTPKIEAINALIHKLKMTTYKSSVLTQIICLFANYDPDFAKKLDSNPALLGFSNGVYDFDKGVFRQSTPDDYLSFSTGYDFTPYDSLPQHSVDEVLGLISKIIPDKDIRDYLLKVLGKSLFGLPDERFYVWTGISGANGKSTLINFLEHALGDYMSAVDVSLLTCKRVSSSNASPDIVRLRGKRIFAFQEPEHNDKLRTGVLKQFTGGDSIIARELYKSPVSFKLQGTMLMCCNDLPSVTSIDGGTWRRIRVIEFSSRFCDNPKRKNEYLIDPLVKYKIEKLKDIFMSILIHYYTLFCKEGLNEPQQVMRATTKYKYDNNKFTEFFEEHIEEKPDGFETLKDLYCKFNTWWTFNNGSQRVPSVSEFARATKIAFGSEKEIETKQGFTRYGFAVSFKDDKHGNHSHTRRDSDSAVDLDDSFEL